MSTILIVEDDQSLREALTEAVSLAGYEVKNATDGYSALTVLNQIPVDMIISDVSMSGMDGHQLLKEVKQKYPSIPMLLMTAYADVEQAINAIKDGAVDYMVKPFEVEQLLTTVDRVVGGTVSEHEDFVAESQASKLLFIKARKVADTAATVLIAGESGTGKEVVARHIHRSSPRKNKPFIAINCAAIPENMLEATLFGYEKGAYTGAVNSNPGKFELADGGTLLLDEITEMDLGLQAKLLRVIQEREIERLGGKKTIKLDVRIIATSNRDLQQAVADGEFRDDLYYRINVFPLLTTPLRQRADDIFPIAKHLLQQHAAKMNQPNLEFAKGVEQRLKGYPWPGNVRELDNVVQRSIILRSSTMITPDDIQFEDESLCNPVDLAMDTEQSGMVKTMVLNAQDSLKRKEYLMIADELQQQNGCRKKTAESLGISPRTLRYKVAKMRELGMEIPSARRKPSINSES